MSRELTIIQAQEMMVKLDAVGPIRLTKILPSGNIAILQVADPNNVPTLAKVLRAIPGKFGRRLQAIEAAIRMSGIVYRNAMRSKAPRQGKSKADRKVGGAC